MIETLLQGELHTCICTYVCDETATCTSCVACANTHTTTHNSCMFVILYETFSRTYPVHDSAAILLVRSGNYRKHVESVKEWYKQQHNNWFSVDGERSQWWVWENVRLCALNSARQIQLYLARITSGTYIHVYTYVQCTCTCTCTYMNMYHDKTNEDSTWNGYVCTYM